MENPTKMLLHAHGVGALATQKQGAGITEIQLATIAKHEANVESGKGLTPTQIGELQKLKAKRDAPPELSDTAKAFVRKMWLLYEKGIRYEVASKYLEKGLWGEQDALKLLRERFGRYFEQNKLRKNNGVFTVLADILEPSIRTGHDMKCSWSAETFMEAELTKDNEWQGRITMEVWDLDVFNVHYCLVDAPVHIYEYELYKFKNKYQIIDESLPEHAEKLERFRRGLIYTDNPAFTKKERVKTFTIHRDESKMEFMYDQVKLALEYYKTLSLDMIVT